MRILRLLVFTVLLVLYTAILVFFYVFFVFEWTWQGDTLARQYSIRKGMTLQDTLSRLNLSMETVEPVKFRDLTTKERAIARELKLTYVIDIRASADWFAYPGVLLWFDERHRAAHSGPLCWDDRRSKDS